MSLKKEEWLQQYLDDELSDEEERRALMVIAEDPELRALLKFDIGLRQELASDAWSGAQSAAGVPAGKMSPGSLPEGFADGVMKAIAQKEQEAKMETPATQTAELETAAGDAGLQETREAASQDRGFLNLWNRVWQPRPVMWRPVWSAGIAVAALMLMVMIPLVLIPLQESDQPPGIPMRQIVEQSPDRVLMRFVYVDRDAESVAVAGDFSDWEPITLTRQNINGDVAWTGIIPLERGQHRYMFLKDGERWATDPLAGRYIDDGFGNKNAVINL